MSPVFKSFPWICNSSFPRQRPQPCQPPQTRMGLERTEAPYRAAVSGPLVDMDQNGKEPWHIMGLNEV
jgi:hypothetical protein